MKYDDKPQRNTYIILANIIIETFSIQISQINFQFVVLDGSIASETKLKVLISWLLILDLMFCNKYLEFILIHSTDAAQNMQWSHFAARHVLPLSGF